MSTGNAGTGDSRPPERACQAAILAAIEQHGRGQWRIHHGRPAQNKAGKWSSPVQGSPGFPDLTLVNPSRQIAVFLELKRIPNQVEDNQLDWLLNMRTVGLDARVWWVPDNQAGLIAVIVGQPLPPARLLLDQLCGPVDDLRRGAAQRRAREAGRLRAHPLGAAHLDTAA